jgi:hypothetical protein
VFQRSDHLGDESELVEIKEDAPFLGCGVSSYSDEPTSCPRL